MIRTAYKIASAVEWDAARADGSYGGSALDLADGYIHLSTGAQLPETARRHYRGRSGLIVARIDLSLLGEALRWEPSRGGDLFPHLYAPLPLTAVSGERTANVDDDGQLVFLDGARTWP